MARRSYAGGAVSTTITGAITATSLTCTLADATGWPDTSTGECYVTFGRGTSSEEKALCTRSGTTLTFASTAKRGVDGTTAVSHAAGSSVEHTLAAADPDEANAHVNSTGAVHGGASLSPGVLVIPTATSPAQTAEGSAVWDSDDDLLTVGTGAARKTMVDTNSTQTMSGKTLTQPTIGDFTNANHTHASATQGGTMTAASMVGQAVRCDNGNSGSTTASPSTSGAVPLSNEVFDTDGFHSTSVNTSRFTVPAGMGGLYLITGSLFWSGGDTNTGRALRIAKNGDSFPALGEKYVRYISSTPITTNVTCLAQLSAGDYVELIYVNDSTTNATILHNQGKSPTLSMVRLSA